MDQNTKLFLERHQTDNPMMPFITAELQGAFIYVLSRSIKRSVLDSITSQHALAKLDVQNKENVVYPPENLDIEFATDRAIEIAKKEKRSQVSVSQRQMYAFLQCCLVPADKAANNVVRGWDQK